MGKRKRSDCDYDHILKKVKKLEQKLRKKQRRISWSSESDTNFSDHTPEPMSRLEEIMLEDSPPTLHVPEAETLGLGSIPEPDASSSSEPVSAEPVTGVNSEGNHDEEVLTLEPGILQLLGEDPSGQKSYGENLHKDIALRWTHILANSLAKEISSDLLKLYLPPENCPTLKAPKLNLEVKAALSEINIKKDLYSQTKQNNLACSLAAIGQVLNWALDTKNGVPPNIIKAMSDAGRLICDSHYKESLSRRFSALNTLNKNMKDTIKNTKIDENLFGSDLSEHIKSSKAITKTGSEMKPPAQRPVYKAPAATHPQAQRGSLNSRGAPRAAAAESRLPPASRRPTRDRRQPAPATTGRRSAGYSRQHTRKR